MENNNRVMTKENIYLDLSKLSEEQRNHIFSLLPTEPHRDAYNIFRNYKYLQFIPKSKFQEKEKWMVDKQAFDKVELTYLEFIKLFEGGESKEVLQVENIKDIAYTEGVLIGLKICKEMWAQGTISHENIQEEIYHYQEELENLNSNQ